MKKIRFVFLLFLALINRYVPKIFHARKRIVLPTIKSGKKSFAFSLFRHKKLLLGLLLMPVIILLGWRINAQYNTYSSFSQGVIGEYTPSNLPLYISSLLSDPLVTIDSAGYTQPKLAKSWQVSNESTVYTFQLKDNLYWNDGSVIKASDIRFDLPDVTISYPDDKTIIFKLTDSFSRFPTLLTLPIFKRNTLIGTGKYKVESRHLYREFLSSLVLMPLDKTFPKIMLRFYQDETTASTALELGEVDSIIGLSDVSHFNNQKTISIKRVTNFNKLTAIFYNTTDPLLQDKNKDLRRALSYVAPKVPGEVVAKTPIPPYSWGYNDNVREYLGKPEEAKKYLEKVSDLKGQKITLTTTPALLSVGQSVVEAWKSIGIDAVLREESGVPQNFQALLTYVSIPSDPDQYVLWHSTQEKTNIAKYSSKRVDKDLEDGRKLSDQKVRQEKYFDFQKIMLDDAPATFLFFPKINIVYRSKSEHLLNQVLPLEILNVQ